MSAAAAKRQKQSNSARPKRSLDNPNEDHFSRLWVDHELLRKHLSSKPKFLIPTDSTMAVNNHYLELADLALNNVVETMPVRNLAANARQRKKA